jgi:hypothetical protein
MSSDLRSLLPEFMLWVLLPLWLIAGDCGLRTAGGRLVDVDQ